MKVKRILSDVTLVIADVEVQLNGESRSSPTLCAVIAGADGRPIFMKMENAIDRPSNTG